MASARASSLKMRVMIEREVGGRTVVGDSVVAVMVSPVTVRRSSSTASGDHSGAAAYGLRPAIEIPDFPS